MSSSGRLTIPAAARRPLGIAGEAEFDVDVSDNRIVLRPLASQDRQLLKRALKDSEEGRVSRMTEKDLLALAPVE